MILPMVYVSIRLTGKDTSEEPEGQGAGASVNQNIDEMELEGVIRLRAVLVQRTALKAPRKPFGDLVVKPAVPRAM